jgi:Dolichyl-phosphate-mannose-protein mannosyltransferase
MSLKLAMRWTIYEKILGVLFLLTVPFVRPWIHGDGRGYYAFARTILFQHNLDFAQDWYYGYQYDPRMSNPSFRLNYLTPNGHFANHWTIGPAILWSPFLLTARAVTPFLDKIRGTHYSDDGFSKPYMIAIALGTLFYGLLTLWISLLVVRKYVPERWAFLAVLGIWLASSFPFYLYVEPSFAHTHSAFLIAVFVWLWDRRREKRTWLQWLILGAIAGLMVDTYYPNALVLVLVLFESLQEVWTSWRDRAADRVFRLVTNNLLFALMALFVFFPTLLTKKILWGSYFQSGYKQDWYWNSPAFFRVCFSSHGVFSWTPILIPAVAGLYLLRRIDRNLSNAMLVTLLAFTHFIGCYQDWHAIPSFGNRFFISFTLFFILGLAVLMKELATLWDNKRVVLSASLATVLLILWNCGVIYQFAAHLFPQSGEVSWSQVAYNQFAVVPGQVTQLVKSSIKRQIASRSGAEPDALEPAQLQLKIKNQLTGGKD